MPYLLPAYDPILSELQRCALEAWGVRKIYEGWPETEPKALPYAVIAIDSIGLDNSHSVGMARQIWTFEIAVVKSWPLNDKMDRSKIEELDKLSPLIMDRNGPLNGQIAYMPRITEFRLNAINPKREEVIGPSIILELSFDQTKLQDATGAILPAEV